MSSYDLLTNQLTPAQKAIKKSDPGTVSKGLRIIPKLQVAPFRGLNRIRSFSMCRLFKPLSC
jgi:hypothetical protein